VKVSKEQAAKNRERILDAASRLIRERGLAGAGVDALTGAAGLTPGSLYSQFGSKDKLIAEALNYTNEQRAAARIINRVGIDDFITTYLSTSHRDNPGKGCFFATVGPEIHRQNSKVRRTFTQKVMENITWLTSVLPGKHKAKRENEAMVVMSTLIGAVVLARAVDDPVLSERLLSVTKEELLHRVREH
jgi:TetR/AcrR family transcriptional repressor of nem operon